MIPALAFTRESAISAFAHSFLLARVGIKSLCQSRQRYARSFWPGEMSRFLFADCCEAYRFSFRYLSKSIAWTFPEYLLLLFHPSWGWIRWSANRKPNQTRSDSAFTGVETQIASQKLFTQGNRRVRLFTPRRSLASASLSLPTVTDLFDYPTNPIGSHFSPD